MIFSNGYLPQPNCHHRTGQVSEGDPVRQNQPLMTLENSQGNNALEQVLRNGRLTLNVEARLSWLRVSDFSLLAEIRLRF